jgi:hypothetical protein
MLLSNGGVMFEELDRSLSWPERLDKVVQKLEVRDKESREERARRHLELIDLMASCDVMGLMLVGGGPGGAWLRLEAFRSYRAGLGTAALACAHAACERELAGWVETFGEEAPSNWRYWGLGQLTKFAKERETLPLEVISALFQLNEKRRILYHFHDDWAPESHTSRAYGLRLRPDKSAWEPGMGRVLLDDGLEVIRTLLLLSATMP